MKYFGKSRLHIARVNDKWIEGQFEWPKALGYEEDDGELMISLLVIWRHIPWDKLQDHQLWNTIQVQMEAACQKWLKIETNFTSLPSVHHYSIYLPAALVTRIWNDGLNVPFLRQSKAILMKAAKDLELSALHGYRKIIQVQKSMAHCTVRDGYLLRKIPTPILVINVFCLNRSLATLDDMTELMSIQKQGDELLKDMFYMI